MHGRNNKGEEIRKEFFYLFDKQKYLPLPVSISHHAIDSLYSLSTLTLFVQQIMH